MQHCKYFNDIIKDYKPEYTIVFYCLRNISLDVNLKSLIYFYGIASTSSQEWDKLFEKYLASTAASEKNKLLYGLSGSREPWVLRRSMMYLFLFTHVSLLLHMYPLLFPGCCDMLLTVRRFVTRIV